MDADAQYLGKPWLKFHEPGVPATVEVPAKAVAQASDEATERTARSPMIDRGPGYERMARRPPA